MRTLVGAGCRCVDRMANWSTLIGCLRKITNQEKYKVSRRATTVLIRLECLLHYIVQLFTFNWTTLNWFSQIRQVDVFESEWSVAADICWSYGSTELLQWLCDMISNTITSHHTIAYYQLFLVVLLWVSSPVGPFTSPCVCPSVSSQYSGLNVVVTFHRIRTESWVQNHNNEVIVCDRILQTFSHCLHATETNETLLTAYLVNYLWVATMSFN